MKEALVRILPLLREIEKKETGLEYVEAVLRYLTDGTDKVTKNELSGILKEVYAEGENIMPTIAQNWIDQGEKIGREEGREEGERNALNRTLTIRFDVVLGKFDKQFAKLDLKSLEQLNEVALKVNSLVDFEKALTDIPPKKHDKTAKKKTSRDENETST